ncbi:PucR family transcriptional regulator [Streptomyces poriticola]|uniref:PucR family transcriptional regulator n=1 Tax=Streptomyces poriticola TaxID=3120506 RepID=UPI002FCE3CB3
MPSEPEPDPGRTAAYPALSPGAQALATRCQSRVNELARWMTRHTFEQLPGYPDLPDDVKDVEIAATVRSGLRLFLRRVHDTHDDPDDYSLFRERAAQRAEEGLPLHMLLRTHTKAAYALWQVLREETAPGEEGALMELVGLLLRGQETVIAAVTETYLDEQAALAAERHEHRRSLVRGLLDGSLPPLRALEELGLESRCSVIHLHLPPEPAVAAASAVAARRRLRRVQIVLERTLGTHAALLGRDGGSVIAPRRAGAGDTDQACEELCAQLRQICGDGVRLAAVPADTPRDVPTAARTAADLVRLARSCGREAGVHRMEDFLLEFHLSRRNEASDRIAALLAPITDRPELLDTLRTHLEHRQDRRGSARLLGIHPNTLDNRLAKITELTGLDIATPRGASLALAALLLHDDALQHPGRHPA